MKKLVGFILLSSFLVVALAPCGSGQKTKTLTVWNWHTPWVEVRKPYLEKYSKLHPEIELKTMIIPVGEYWKKVTASIMAGKVPDIVQFHNNQVSSLLEFLEPFPEDLFPLSKMREEYLGFDQGFVMQDGKVYFLPSGLSSGLIYYNVDMWHEAGLGKPPKTWEGLRKTAVKLTRYDEEGGIRRAGFPFGWGYLGLLWSDLLYQQGGWLFTEDGTAADPSWVKTPGVKALTFLKNLIFEDKVFELGFLPLGEAFGTENAAMAYVWTWFTGWASYNYPELEWSVFTLPTETGEMRPTVGRNNWEVGQAVLKAVPDDEKREAFKFIKWLNSQDEYLIAYNIENTCVPGKKALWGDPKIVNDPVVSVLKEQIPYTIFPGEFPGFIHSPCFQDMEIRVLQGVSVKEVLEKTKEAVDMGLKEKPVRWNVERQYEPPKE